MVLATPLRLRVPTSVLAVRSRWDCTPVPSVALIVAGLPLGASNRVLGRSRSSRTRIAGRNVRFCRARSLRLNKDQNETMKRLLREEHTTGCYRAHVHGLDRPCDSVDESTNRPWLSLPREQLALVRGKALFPRWAS